MTLTPVDPFTRSVGRGLLDLPTSFRFDVLARAGERAVGTAGVVPGRPTGVGQFPLADEARLAQNHDQGRWGAPSVVGPRELTYDAIAAGGVTILTLDARRKVVDHRVGLAGALFVCAGARTPWGTWLACEQTEHRAVGRYSADHGWVFEVDPLHERNNLHPSPLTGMGRFRHAGAAIDPDRGHVYLSESAMDPDGILYRFIPRERPVGYGDLRGGGSLDAMVVDGLDDVSVAVQVGQHLVVRWAPVPDPIARVTSTRKQFDHRLEPTGTYVPAAGGPATRWPDVARTRWAAGRLWIVRGDRLDGQVWSYDPVTSLLQLASQRPTAGHGGECLACAVASNFGPTTTALAADRCTLYAGLPDEGATVAIRGPFEDHH